MIMVIEDNDDIRLTLGMLLELEGYEVCAFNGARAALEALRSGPRPSAIVLDLHMPDMDGAEFRRQQLADPAFCLIPTIVLSGSHADARAIQGVGLLRFLPKPVDVKQLIACIAEYALAPRAQ